MKTEKKSGMLNWPQPTQPFPGIKEKAHGTGRLLPAEKDGLVTEQDCGSGTLKAVMHMPHASTTPKKPERFAGPAAGIDVFTASRLRRRQATDDEAYSGTSRRPLRSRRGEIGPPEG